LDSHHTLERPRGAAPDDEAGARERWAALIAWASVLFFLVCVMIGTSGGVRGTDQYWYLGDTETLLRGDPPSSNNLFPRQLLFDGMERSPLLHDILPQRAVLPLARVLGPYWGWIAMNVIAMLIAAWLTHRAVRREAGAMAAALAVSALLLLPLSLASTTQMLAETSLVPILAAAMLLFQRPGGFVKYTALALVLTLAVMARFTAFPLLMLLPLAPFTERIVLGRRLLLFAWTGVLAVAGMALSRALFGGIPIPGSALAMGINGRGMELWLNTEPVILSFGSLVAKLKDFLRSLTDGSPLALGMAATNWLLMVAAAFGAITLWRQRRLGLALFIGAVLAVNLATVSLYQNQVRYVVPSYPVLIVATAILLGSATPQWRRRVGIVAGCLVALLAPAAIGVAMIARKEGLAEATQRGRLESLALELEGPGDLICVGFSDQMLGHCLRPRVVLFAASALPDSDWSRILAMPRWRWIVCREDEIERLRELGVSVDRLRTVEHRGTPLLLIEMRDP